MGNCALERTANGRCSGHMRPLVLAGMVLLLVAACSGTAKATPQAPARAGSHLAPGGCAGTVLTDAEPPRWAQGGWNHKTGDPWPVPWANGSGGNAVAFLFAIQLVAGGSPRSDGSNNKVLWVVKDAAVSNFLVNGHPLGHSEPRIKVAGGPSIVDPQTDGCWTFLLSWTSGTEHTSTINLDVLPKGSLPART